MSELVRRGRAELQARPATAVLAAALCGLVLGPRHDAAPAIAAALTVLVCATPQRCLMLIAAVLAGAVVGEVRSSALERTTLGPRLGHVVSARVPLLESPRATPWGWRALAAIGGERVLLRARGPAPDLPAGRHVDVLGALRRPLEHEAWLRSKHVHAVLDSERVRDTGAGRRGPAGALDGVRTRAQRALTAHLPHPQGALLRGMVLGDDAALAVAERDRLRRAGLGHLVAASGANVALLAALALVICGLLGVGLRGRLLVVLALIAVYVPLAGAGPSIQRAGIMGAAAVVATMAGRPAVRAHVVLLAAVLTLGIDPAALTDPGWQLSFAAVLSIALLAGPLRAGLLRRRVPGPLADGCALALAATVGTAPVSAAVFGTVSLAGLLANVLVAPLVAPITWIGMLAALFAQVWPAAGAWIAWTAGAPVAAVLAAGRFCSALPAAQIQAPVIAVGVVSCAIGLVILVRRTRRVAAAIAPLVAVGALATAHLLRTAPPAPPDARTLRISFLDIGQGDATLVQSGTRALLVDAGPPDGPVLERLRALGIRRLDVLAGTHAQADHLGGADRVLRELPVGVVLDGRDGVRERQGDELANAAARRGVRLVAARAGQRIAVGGAVAEVLWPPPGGRPPIAGADPNDRAIVLRVTGGGVRVLLTADAESGVLSRLDPGPVDILKVSHHGSADPGLPALLSRLHPRLAVIEVGRSNTYGHPSPPTLAALRHAGVPTLRTDRDGTIIVDARNRRLHVQTGS